jgi:hypothetical protein
MNSNKNQLVEVSDFLVEKECNFKGERYLVRDNGAVLRCAREGARSRSKDNYWTFGDENKQNPYLHLCNARVHRIVATAFHGAPPDPNYVVDHIDNNCRNNRPENLRWLTRLENTLLNPTTRKKIEYLCGSVEAFLENPNILNDMNLSPEYSWMRRVTKEEAQACKTRMELFANCNTLKKTNTKRSSKSFTKRALKPLHKWEAGLVGEPGLDFADTPWCAQYMWDRKLKLPLCPDVFWKDPIQCYFESLKIGSIFAHIEKQDSIVEFTIEDFDIVTPGHSFIVMCKTNKSTWATIGVQMNKKQHFIHFLIGLFEDRSEALESFQKIRSEDRWGNLSFANMLIKNLN